MDPLSEWQSCATESRLRNKQNWPRTDWIIFTSALGGLIPEALGIHVKKRRKKMDIKIAKTKLKIDAKMAINGIKSNISYHYHPGRWGELSSQCVSRKPCIPTICAQ